MSVSFELEAVSRSDTGKGASRRLRKTGMVPGIVYGAGKDPEMMHRHPAKPFIIHLDLLRVSDDEKIKMHVPLHFLNETKAVGVKAGGQLSREITDVEVSCLPKDLPEFIEIDVMDLNIGESIHLSEIKLPEGVEILQLGLGEDHDSAVVAIHAVRGSAEDEEDGAASEEEGGEAAAEE